MTKQKKISYVNTYKKLTKKKKEAKESAKNVVTAECGTNKQSFIIINRDMTNIERKPIQIIERKDQGFKRDTKKLHQVWDYIKTHNLILKVFSCYVIKDGKKINLTNYNKYMKFLYKNNKFWLINCNYILDLTKVLPKNEIIGAHIYQDGNMQFTTKTKMFLTCEPYYGKKVERNGEN